MLDFAREAVSFAEESSREDLDNNRMLQLSLLRLIEVIGEAATRMPADSRSNYAAIDWDIVWDTVNNDLPPLIREVERILESQS